MNEYRKVELKQMFQERETVDLTVVNSSGEVTDVICHSYEEAISEIAFYENENEVYF